ncbi:MAG TPA: decaprenyl-phosphate phosphoribosyltransferase [Gaiellaceae bacterium]|nr:decaprenyl-phosphate phosphoribosyltransferase [Gaiellaceae bacterium]
MAVAVLDSPRSRARALLAGMRPRQWSKNLLLFAGLVFAAKLGDAVRWLEALAAFAAYCAASSAAYLVNDVRDAAHDRMHPVKRLRPVATGELPARAAVVAAVLLALAALGAAAALGPWSVLFMAGFVALQAAYSTGLKHVVLIDVLAIAGLFVVRASAGAQAVDVRISPWLLICTGLLALFLALAKRRAELVLVGGDRLRGLDVSSAEPDAGASPASRGRPVLEGYSLALVDQLVTVVAASTVIAYSLYTFTARDSKAMMATVPFVLYGVFRYLLLLHRHDLGEEPENVLLTDVPLLLTIAAWAATSAAILALT